MSGQRTTIRTARRQVDRLGESSPRTRHILRAIAATCWLVLVATGCAASGLGEGPRRRDVVDQVRIEGIPDAKIKKKVLSGIGTKPSSSFLWRHSYETYDPVVLERDLERIERELQRHGYYEAKVRAARIIRLDEIERQQVVLSPIIVEIEVDPGPPVLIGKLETKGLAALPFSVARASAQENRLRVGQIFDEGEFENAKVDIANSLADRGYAFATVSGTAEVDLVQQRARVTMAAEPGPRSTLGKITLEGLEALDEKHVRKILDLEEGELYSRKQIRLARSALYNLGTFSKVEVIPDLSHPESKTVPLTVRFEESSLRQIKLGGGARVDQLRTAVVGQATWTHLNFLGGLRKLTIDTRPGLTFFPTNVNYLRTPTNVFLENFLSIRLDQPAFIEARTTGFHEGGYNIYPLLNQLVKGDNPREELVVGYHELTTSFGLSRWFFENTLETELSIHWQGNFPFTYQTPESGAEYRDAFEQVHAVYPELITRLQLLDDPIETTRGISISNSIQVATGVFGTLSDVRIRPELRTFIPLDKKHKVVLATRVGVGLLLNPNYGEDIRNAGRSFDYTDPTILIDQQKMIFRTFYSGGPGSNRGYPYRQIGPRGPIGFLLPRNVDCTTTSDRDSTPCIRPLGGFTLWEASVELRFRLLPNWSFVTFVDASDVSLQLAKFDFRQPHLSVGPGVRYHSPVGPVRLDWGIRIPGMQSRRTAPDEPRDVSEVPPYNETEWWKQFAVHLLIGEDF